jgi:hypothetical protein
MSPVRSSSVTATDMKNGEATSSSPFQSLLQGDEDIAAPKPIPLGLVSSGARSGSGSNRDLLGIFDSDGDPAPDAGRIEMSPS